MEKKRYVRVDPFTGFPEKDVKEDAPTTSTAGVAATGDDPTVVVRKKKKLYDGRTTVAKKFIQRILKQRESRRVAEEVEEDFRGYGKHFALTLTPTLRKKVMKLLDKEKIEYDKFSRKFLFIGKDGGKAPISMKDQKSILSKIEKEIGKDNFNYTFQKEEVELDEKVKQPRQLINPSKEVMVVKNNKVIVVDKKDLKQYTSKGWSLAEDVELDEMRGIYVVRNHNGRMIAKNKNRNAIDKERKKYETQTGNKTTMNIEKEPVPDLKEEVELDEVLKPKDKKVIDDFVQANKGTGAQNFTKRGNIVDYEGRSLEKSGMGAQQIASIESDPKDSHKIKVHAKMDSRSTQSIVNYLKKSAKKYNIKVEETVKEETMEITEEVITLKTKDNVMGLKVFNGAKGLGLKAALLGKYVRVKGSKKQINDFGRTVIGKSSMGSPTDVGDFGKGSPTPQEDRMLNKRLKEELDIQTSFTASILEKVNDFGNEHELVETNLKVLQNIVKKKQNQKVKFKDKQATVDLFTASAIMKVYDAVKPDNKKKIEKLMNGTLVDFLKLQKFAMKQVKFR